MNEAACVFSKILTFIPYFISNFAMGNIIQFWFCFGFKFTTRFSRSFWQDKLLWVFPTGRYFQPTKRGTTFPKILCALIDDVARRYISADRGDSKKKAKAGFCSRPIQKVVDVRCFNKCLQNFDSNNVRENQEPKCRKRRVNNRRRILRWAHLAGLSSTVYGSR